MKLRFFRKQQEAPDVWSFFFEPIDKLSWLPGQSIRLELPRPTWGVDERRFSIASAPHEKYIQITTRIGQSSFKHSLDTLTPGNEINGFNIEGDFLLQQDSRPRLMIAGGIGITAFRPMLAQAIHDKKPLNTTLIYSSNDQPAVFQAKLDAWQTFDPSLYVYYLFGQRFSIAGKANLASYWLGCDVYLSGPEAMVESLGKQLMKKGLPRAHLKTDLFTGL